MFEWVSAKNKYTKYIYIVQEREHVGTNIVKIGRIHKQSYNNRLRAYPNGTTLIFSMMVRAEATKQAEDALIRELAASCIHRKDLGHEYFEGPSLDVVQDIALTVIRDFRISKVTEAHVVGYDDRQPDTASHDGRHGLVTRFEHHNKTNCAAIVDGDAASTQYFAADDTAAALMFIEQMRDRLRACGSRVYVRDGPAWTNQDGVVQKVLMATCLMSNIQRINEEGKTWLMSSLVPSAKRIIEAARALVPSEPDLEDLMWRSNVGVVCFRNGMWDFRRRTFFKYEERPDVMPRLCVPRDFPVQRPTADDRLMEEVRCKLLLSTLGSDAKVDTYLRLIARATAGEYADKQWAVMLGERNCGKGLLQSVNQEAWGPYVNTVNANALLLQQHASADAAKSLSWALDCEHTRQTYTNEDPAFGGMRQSRIKCEAGSRHIKLDGNLIKSFQSGGDVMSGRKNYQDERTFRVGSKLIMNLNDIPEITPRDAATTMVLFKFPYKFVSQAELDEAASSSASYNFMRLRDDGFKDSYCKRADVIDAFIWMVIDAYTPGPVVPCRDVVKDTQDYLEDVGDELPVIRQSFAITGSKSDYVLTSQLADFCSDNRLNMSVTLVKDRLVRMGAWYDKRCAEEGKAKACGKRGLRGVKLLNEPIPL